MTRAREQAVAGGAATIGDSSMSTRLQRSSLILIDSANVISQRRAILQHIVKAVDILVDLCGDFLSLKVTEDLWPLFKSLLMILISRVTTQPNTNTNTTNSFDKTNSSNSMKTSRSVTASTTSVRMSEIRGITTKNPNITASGNKDSIPMINDTQQQQQQRTVSDHYIDVKVVIL